MLVKFNPFGSVVRRDSFFDDFFTPVSTGFEPHVDVKENDKEFHIVAELPGLDKNDFKLTVENNVLTLEGEKKIENEEKADNYFRSERSYGTFKRSFRLTDSVDSKKISAEYKNGILQVRIPKAEKAKPKEIEIAVK